MSSGIEDSASNPPLNSSANFECNICFELAQEPIVTLCGHLFCWPCLYKWLHFHTQSHQCPICKAVVEEDKLVPLYGRGKTSTDPRLKSVTYPGIHIPNRPAGQRPETAPRPPPESSIFPRHEFGFNQGLGAFVPSLFGPRVHGYASLYGPAGGFRYGFPHSFHGGHVHGHYGHGQRHGRQDYHLKILLVFLGFCVLLLLLSQ